MSMLYKVNHNEWSKIAVVCNSEGGMSVQEYDEFMLILSCVRDRLRWLAEQKGCMSCMFWNRGCEKANFAFPPEAVQKTGCELYENRHVIPY